MPNVTCQFPAASRCGAAPTSFKLIIMGCSVASFKAV
jgi:hypothetical protein